MAKRFTPTFTQSSIINFGKHRGMPVEQLIQRYPTYVDWALSEGAFRLTSHAYKQFEKRIAETIASGYTRLSRKKENVTKPLAVMIARKNHKGIYMNKKAILVIHTNDPHDTVDSVTGSKYSYLTDLQNVEVGERVVLDCERGLQFGIVTQVEGLTRNQIERAEAWVVCTIDLQAHKERLKIQEKAQELFNVMEEEAQKMDRMLMFQRMAEVSPRMNSIMHELNKLDSDMMPDAMLKGLPTPEESTVDTVFEDETETENDNDIY